MKFIFWDIAEIARIVSVDGCKVHQQGFLQGIKVVVADHEELEPTMPGQALEIIHAPALGGVEHGE